MPQFYNNYCSYAFILGGDDTIFQYNPKILKYIYIYIYIESPYQLATNTSTSYIVLAFCEHNNAQYNKYKLTLTRRKKMIYILKIVSTYIFLLILLLC
jgi:hypothetical protein